MEKSVISTRFRELQLHICQALEHADGGGKFMEDEWSRPGGGGGQTRVLTSGVILEKGGVNFSAVWGTPPPQLVATLKLDPAASSFFATGVSLVLHPRNPFVPIIHMNIRYFELSDGTCWFGGGIDLTPHYVDPDSAREFHTALKATCDRHDTAYYPRFRKWADDYFYLPHRQETRGIGGIFFDYLKPDESHTVQELFTFVMEVGNTFAPLYTRFMGRGANLPFTERERHWQEIRRGRYVEFNLLHDRGTKFGIETQGRTESILMSMPPVAQWEYNYVPEANTPEALTQSYLVKDYPWI